MDTITPSETKAASMPTQKISNTAGGIDRIQVKGYKSIYNESSLDIANLTILAGANSSGKSSVVQPLLLLKQTLDATYDPGALLLDGPNVRFTSAEQLLSKVTGKSRSDSFSIRLEVQSSRLLQGLSGSLNITFKKSLGISPNENRNE